MDIFEEVFDPSMRGAYHNVDMCIILQNDDSIIWDDRTVINFNSFFEIFDVLFSSKASIIWGSSLINRFIVGPSRIRLGKWFWILFFTLLVCEPFS